MCEKKDGVGGMCKWDAILVLLFKENLLKTIKFLPLLFHHKFPASSGPPLLNIKYDIFILLLFLLCVFFFFLLLSGSNK